MSGGGAGSAGCHRLAPHGLALACALALSCSDPPKPAPQAAELDGTLIARVGPEEIAAETVLSIASAQQVDTSRALELATFDALTAVEGRARGLDTTRRRELNAVLARALIAELADEARAEAPPSAEEIEQHTRDYWLEVDRPPVVVTVHALVHVAQDADAASVDRALALARKIGTAVAPAADKARAEPAPDHVGRLGLQPPKDPAMDDFISRAQAVDKQGLEVTAQPLPPVADDNLTIEPQGRRGFDPAYVSGAFKLAQRGDVSEPSRSTFGFHVIMLLARAPALRLSLEERRRFFEPRIVEIRTRRRIDELLQRLGTATKVDIDRSIDDVLGQVRVHP